MRLKLSFVLIIFLLLVGSGHAVAPRWNSSFSYRAEINVTNSNNNNLYNYTENLNVSYLSGMNTSFADLRFVYYNSTSGISTLLGSTDNSTSALLPDTNLQFLAGNYSTEAVMIPELPANSNTTIYMYYGNPSATSIANSTQAYLFFSNGSSLSSWTVSGSTVSSSVGVPPPSIQSTARQYAYIDAVPDYNTSQLYEWDYDIEVGDLADFKVSANSSGYGTYFKVDGRSGLYSFFLASDGWGVRSTPVGANLPQALANVWYDTRIYQVNSTSFAVNLSGIGSMTFTPPLGYLGGYISVYGDAATYGGYVDNIVVKKYAPITPPYTISYIPYINVTAPISDYSTNYFNAPNIDYIGYLLNNPDNLNISAFSIFINGTEYQNTTDAIDRKSTRLNSSHTDISRMPSSA